MAAAAAAEPVASVAASKKSGMKKLVLIAIVLTLVLAAGGAGAVYLLKKKAAAEQALDGDEEAPAVQTKLAKPDPKHPPTFLPLDPFVVNLSDKDVDRYAQVGVTLEVEDAKSAEQLKLYMPAIRNGILMVMAHKSSQQLLDRAGKELLAQEILRESVRPLGIDVPLPTAPAASGAAAEHGAAAEEAHAQPKGHDDGEHNPVRRVHFSNFIIQ